MTGPRTRTREIVASKIAGIDWITLVDTGAEKRNLGTGEVLAFKRGLATVGGDAFEFVVKLDADVRLEPDYFAKVLTRMSQDPEWGIASGVYWEEKAGLWRPVRMPAYHAAGASKVVRRACYEDIGGFVAEKGWDTLDEIRAGMRGWKTGHFADIRFDHLKPEGSAMGSLATHRFHGEIYYRTGGGLLFLLPKAFYRMLSGNPRFTGGLALLQGYLLALIAGERRLVNKAEARFYRRMLMTRLGEFVGPGFPNRFRRS